MDKHFSQPEMNGLNIFIFFSLNVKKNKLFMNKILFYIKNNFKLKKKSSGKEQRKLKIKTKNKQKI